MEKVVYLLGAGFSAPLGLPVMSNFITKAKDMYIIEEKKYPNFLKVFNKINEISKIKNYFQADLFNIEEIFSILEMSDFANNSHNSKLFSDFITDVIKYYTPDIQSSFVKHSNWYEYLGFEDDDKWRKYGCLTASLMNLKMVKKELDDFSEMRTGNKTKLVFEEDNINIKYSVISFNYDMVIETPFKFIKNKYNKKLEFSKLSVAKLHGSIDKNNIVPPTWNKYSNKSQKESWKLAYNLLSEANHIRIIGYSLPLTDSYIKYFFKSAMIKSNFLKTIDVICKDPTGIVKKQYDNFIDFNYYRFKNSDISNYLDKNVDAVKKTYNLQDHVLYFNCLEKIHSEFMNE